MPYGVVDGSQTKKTVQFLYASESDGVDHATNQSFPFYPIPDEAITQPPGATGLGAEIGVARPRFAAGRR